MSQQVVNRGSFPGDNTGELLYDAFGKINANFNELYTIPGVINVKDSEWGATGDGVTDDTLALQAAIDEGRSTGKSVYLPAGTYKITAPLWVGVAPGSSSGFASGHLFGDRKGYDSNLAGAVIDASSITDTFAIAIQFARQVVIENILIDGANLAPGNLVSHTPTGYPTRNQADWITAGLRSNRYSPYAGIVVDPTSGFDPGGGNGYPGFTYHSSTSGSSSVILRNVSVRRFVVGVLISPAISTQQGDRIDLINCNVGGCDINWAACQSQNRANTIYGGNWGGARIIFDGASHGAQNGTAPKIYSPQIGFCYHVFNFNNALGSPLSVHGMYIEGAMSLGCYGHGTSTNSDAVVLEGCTLNLGMPLWLKHPTSLFFECHAPLRIISSTLGFHYDFVTNLGFTSPVINLWGNGSQAQLDSCMLGGGDLDNHVSPLLGWHQDGDYPVSYSKCRLSSNGSSYLLDDYVNRHWTLADSSPRKAGISRYDMQRGAQFLEYRNKRYQYKHGSDGKDYVTVPVLNSSYTENTTTQDGTVSFTTNGSQGYLMVGDMLHYQVAEMMESLANSWPPLLRVRSVTPNGGNDDIVCDAMCDVDQLDGSYALNHVKLVRPCWAMHPTKEMTGDFTSASAVVTNISPDTSFLRAGDFLNDALPFITSGTRVLSVDGANTITMTSVAGATVQGGRIEYDRWDLADADSPFISFPAATSTPSIVGGRNFKTVDATTITDFLGGRNGQEIFVVIGVATTIDFTTGNLSGNGGVNWSAPAGGSMICVHDQGTWYCKV